LEVDILVVDILEVDILGVGIVKWRLGGSQQEHLFMERFAAARKVLNLIKLSRHRSESNFGKLFRLPNFLMLLKISLESDLPINRQQFDFFRPKINSGSSILSVPCSRQFDFFSVRSKMPVFNNMSWPPGVKFCPQG
jgi:hypothetical protein